MKITFNPLLMLRTPSSLSLNALLIINGLLFEREGKKKQPNPTLYSFGLILPELFIADTVAAGTGQRKPPACPLCWRPHRSCHGNGMGRENEREEGLSPSHCSYHLRKGELLIEGCGVSTTQSTGVSCLAPLGSGRYLDHKDITGRSSELLAPLPWSLSLLLGLSFEATLSLQLLPRALTVGLGVRAGLLPLAVRAAGRIIA